MTARVLCLTALVALCGCEAPPPVLICPSLRSYSAAEQAALAAELPNDGLQAQRWLRDYIALRDQVRACSSAHE